MYEAQEDTTRVVSIFNDAYQPIKSVTLLWHGEEVVITEIGYLYQLEEGQKIRHAFSCTDGVSFFQMVFNDEDLPVLESLLASRGAN